MVGLSSSSHTILSFFQLNYSLATLSHGIPKIMPSLDSLVILNFMLKSRPSIFTVAFLVLRYAFLSLYTRLVLFAIWSVIGSSFS